MREDTGYSDRYEEQYETSLETVKNSIQKCNSLGDALDFIEYNLPDFCNIHPCDILEILKETCGQEKDFIPK